MTPEPTLFIRRVRDPDCSGIQVERDGVNRYVVLSALPLDWLTTLSKVSEHIERRPTAERDD